MVKQNLRWFRREPRTRTMCFQQFVLALLTALLPIKGEASSSKKPSSDGVVIFRSEISLEYVKMTVQDSRVAFHVCKPKKLQTDCQSLAGGRAFDLARTMVGLQRVNSSMSSRLASAAYHSVWGLFAGLAITSGIAAVDTVANGIGNAIFHTQGGPPIPRALVFACLIGVPTSLAAVYGYKHGSTPLNCSRDLLDGLTELERGSSAIEFDMGEFDIKRMVNFINHEVGKW